MFKPNLLCKDYAPGIPYCFHKVNEGQKNYKPGGNWELFSVLFKNSCNQKPPQELKYY